LVARSARQDLFLYRLSGNAHDAGSLDGKCLRSQRGERNGTFSDLTGSVSGPYLASLLAKELGQPVSAGEPYTSIFPHRTIPQSVWSAPGKTLMQYIPAPNVGSNQFSSAVFSQTVRDDKGAVRIDGNSRLGQLSAYYFIDDYRLDNPFPGSVAGASIPGFDALFIGRAQLLFLEIRGLSVRRRSTNFTWGIYARQHHWATSGRWPDRRPELRQDCERRFAASHATRSEIFVLVLPAASSSRCSIGIVCGERPWA
jgi:hypothetical protein